MISSAPDHTTAKANRLTPTLFLLLAAVAFLMVGLDRVNTAVNPAFEDTGSYLEGALVIKENGGIANFINSCLNGRFKVESQHPLYLLLLSPFASRDLSFFPKAQLVSLAIGLCVLVSLFFVARDLFGQHVSFIATGLLALNLPFLHRSSVVACETLLMLFVLLGWYFAVKGGDHRKYWLLAGLASGLAYMTKATGIFMIPVFVLSTVVVYKWSMVKDKYFWSFLLVVIIVSSPLIARNLMVYGSPLYEGANSNVAWLDSYRELSDPKHELLVNWPEHTYSAKNLPTMRSYLESHSVAEIAKRAVRGMIGEFGLLLRSTYTLVLPYGQRYWAALALSLCLLGLAMDPDRRRRVYAGVTMVAFFLPSAWYFQIIPDMRFITPLIPIICLYCGVGSVEVLKYLEARMSPRVTGRPRAFATSILAAGLIAVSAYFAAGHTTRPLLHTVELSDDQQELFAWLKDNVHEHDIVIMGPTSRYWGYLWHARFRGSLIPTAGNARQLGQEEFEAFHAYLKKRGVTVVVVHGDNYTSPAALGEYFAYSEEGGLLEKKAIADWTPVYEYSKRPKAFRIYRL